MNYHLYTGTPNTLAERGKPDTFGAVKRRARGVIADWKEFARKFDWEGLGELETMVEDINRCADFKGERVWKARVAGVMHTIKIIRSDT